MREKRLFMIKRKTKIFSTSIAIIVVSLLVFGLKQVGFFYSTELLSQDKLFTRETVSGKVVIIGIDNDSIQANGQWPWSRAVHAQMIKRLNDSNVLAIGYDVTFSEQGRGDTEFFHELEKHDNIVFPLEGNLVLKKGSDPEFNKILWPLDEITNNHLVGHTSLLPGGDGKVRKAPLDVKYKEQIIEPFFWKILQTANYVSSDNDFNTSFDRNGLFHIKFFGPSGTIENYSFNDVLSEDFNNQLLENKIVLVGATAKDLHDEFFTPSSKGRAIAGVEIQANLMESYLQNRYIHNESNWFYNLFIIFVVAILTALISYRKIFYALPLLIVLYIFYLIFVIINFSFGNLVTIFYPLLTIVVTFSIVFLVRFFLETIEKKKLRAGFSQYVAKEVVDEIIKNPEKLKLGGENREMTILFSDIRSFTALSEGMSPHELVEFLNEYLTLTTDVILENKGVVDKFIGDAVMALWGAPLDNENHAIDGVRTALYMFDKLEEFNVKMKKRGLNQINIGIGLNTGEVVVGNLGSNQRFDYTVIGDPVNLASRLEGLTKYYGVRIIVSSKTKDQLDNQFVVKYLDKVAVKGKKTGVEIYEVKDFIENKGKYENELVEFNNAIGLYLNQDWVEAKKQFDILKNKYSDSKLVDIYLERLNEYIKRPPEDFDGTFRADFK